jgi:cytochrome c
MKEIQIPLALTEQEALDLAQFVKRVGWQEMRQNAVDEDETYRIRDAIDKVRKALAEVGFSPR